MSQHTVTVGGRIVPIQTSRSLTPAKIENSTEVGNQNICYNGFCQQLGDTKNLPAYWLNQRRITGGSTQHEDPCFQPNIAQQETNFGIY